MKNKSTSPDYIEPSSDRHAEHIGLRKADKADEPQIEGWALIDLTAFGPLARPEFLREVLRGKVSTLRSGGAPPVQSDDPLLPNYAPPLWRPSEVPVTGEI